MDPKHLKEGVVVVLRPLDDIPQHLFRIAEIYDDCVTGYSLTGPLAGEYGEPDLDLILRVHGGDLLGS
ncbi:hypothetical protein R3X27_24915 [Tropicimonas sp. TH_r6]|uniref:hypothetical protein n=1 Tax=Tropicimonas sp. TH_r6 TaxID=3082085 RepID=UPI002953EF93|nr:hypothetical protein [Tropicimonas sp. TH_r6]MDV7145931.1 hypothetical protein [Tropicimonas sp. TH_r6]